MSPAEHFHAKLSLKGVALPIICIRSKQDPSFPTAISEVIGLSMSELDGVIEEDVREHTSNLVTNLISSHAGKIVLYAHAHLKYFGPAEKKDFVAFFQAGKVRDAVSRFVEWLG